MFIKPEIPLKNLSESIKRLSDFFIQNPQKQTPWSEKYCQDAYKHYFLPLNFLRVQKVIERGSEVGFFEGLENTIDWGAGPGTASFALNEGLNLKRQILIENAKDAVRVFSEEHKKYLTNPEVQTSMDTQKLKMDLKKSMLVMSYSFTELVELPKGWDHFEALMILEPSTRDDGRRLLELRKKLIAAGYFIWAPCTHQGDCPLLEKSKNDWCHDRIHVKAPDWFLEVERNLPFKNKTITTSYLLARKMKPVANFDQVGRLVGDSLEEKGKTRQMFCRNSDREFLAWMHKKTRPENEQIIFPRGELFKLPDADKIEIKSNEIRM